MFMFIYFDFFFLFKQNMFLFFFFFFQAEDGIRDFHVTGVQTCALPISNVLDSVPGPLRDRMEVIDLPGYTEDEKFEIAHRYLVGRQLAANGLTAEQAEIGGGALRSAAMKIAEGTAAKISIAPEDLHEILGPHRFESEVAMRTSLPGVATGLAWTPVGGDILFIEATRIPGKGVLILTGQ